MEDVQSLRSALDGVPLPLLTPEAVRVLEGVNTSLDIIETSNADRPVVVLIGPTGAGKSSVFNSIVGAGASPEGALRPTTASAVVAGSLPEVVSQVVPDAVVVHGSGTRFTLVDTPGWVSGLPEIADLVPVADLVVMVVSPIRYADASVVAVWKTLDLSKATLVLNRVATSGDETTELLSSVTDIYGVEPYVIGEGGEGQLSICDHIDTSVPASRSTAVASIMGRAAGAGARLIAREVTNAAPDLGKVTSAVDNLPVYATDTSTFDVQESWNGTRDGILARVEISVRDRDDTIVRSSGTDMAERTVESMGPWNPEDLLVSLDAWHVRCLTTFTDVSSVRWRRANAKQLIERFSWSIATNPGIVAPKRFSRIIGERGMDAISDVRSDLETVVSESVEARRELWRTQIVRFGDYQPGALASAADAIENQREARD